MCEWAWGPGGHSAPLLLPPRTTKGRDPGLPCCRFLGFSGAELWFSGAEGALPCSGRAAEVSSMPVSGSAPWWTRIWNRFYWVPWHEGIHWNPILAAVPSPVLRGVSCPHCLMRLCFKIILSLRHQLIYFNSTSNLCLISFHIQVSHLALMNCNCF